MSDEAAELRPAKLWYWVGGILAAVGGVLQVVGGAWYLSLLVEDGLFDTTADELTDLARVTPGEPDVVSFPEPGRYFVYVQSPSGDPFESLVLSGEDVVVEPVSGGPPIAVEPAESQIRVRRDGGSLGAQLEFEIEEPGRYEVTVAERAEGQELFVGPRVESSVPDLFASGDMGTAVVVNLLSGLVFMGGQAVVIVTAVRRSMAESRRRRLTRLPPPPDPEEVTT
jgi:hypothetical protein